MSKPVMRKDAEKMISILNRDNHAAKERELVGQHLRDARSALALAVSRSPARSALQKDIDKAWDQVDSVLCALGEGGAMESDYDADGNWK